MEWGEKCMVGGGKGELSKIRKKKGGKDRK